MTSGSSDVSVISELGKVFWLIRGGKAQGEGDPQENLLENVLLLRKEAGWVLNLMLL